MKAKHIHKYMRVIFGARRVTKIDGKKRIIPSEGREVFKCQVPECNSFMPREMVCGNVSICWVCELPLILDMENTKLKKPTHEQCRRIKEQVA